jgi:hypothetical protein
MGINRGNRMAPFRPEEGPRFVRFPAFTREWELNQADRRAISAAIAAYRQELEHEFSWRQPSGQPKHRSNGDGYGG